MTAKMGTKDVRCCWAINIHLLDGVCSGAGDGSHSRSRMYAIFEDYSAPTQIVVSNSTGDIYLTYLSLAKLIHWR